MAADVTTIWIDNPPLNVITSAVADGLTSQLQAVGPETRLVVIRGRGEKAFSAGADVKEFADDGKPPAGIQPLTFAIEMVPVPVVAAIHGFCLGGGLEAALACDVRIAAAGASFALPEVRLGLIPGGGGTQRLPRVIAPGRAAWMMLSGERITAAQAEEWGLVQFVADDLDAGIAELGASFGAGSPNAQRELKRLLRSTRDGGDDRAELEAFMRCLRSDDGREGIAAFSEKRPPSWSDPTAR